MDKKQSIYMDIVFWLFQIIIPLILLIVSVNMVKKTGQIYWPSFILYNIMAISTSVIICIKQKPKMSVIISFIITIILINTALLNIRLFDLLESVLPK